MTEALEKNIRKVVPYVPGEQPQNPDVIKLNTNENPYSPDTWRSACVKKHGRRFVASLSRPDKWLSCKSTGRLL